MYNLNLHLQSIHSTSPIIISEDGKEKKPEILALTNAPAEEMEIKHPSLMNHVVLWSTNNHYVKHSFFNLSTSVLLKQINLSLNLLLFLRLLYMFM